MSSHSLLSGLQASTRTALHAAAELGFYAGVELLLDHGADPSPYDLTNALPLTLALRGGHGPCSKLLLDLTAKEVWGESGLG